MTTAIDNAAAARTIEGADWSPANGLTAEGLMAYCASRLNSLDALITSRFDEQQKRNGALKEAGAVIARLNNWSFVSSGADVKNSPEAQAAHKENAAGFAAMYNSATDPEVKNKIADAYRMITGKGLVVNNGKAEASQLNKDTVVLDLDALKGTPAAEWQGFIGGVKSVQDGLTKDSEMSMLQLQSIVSQRQLAVQMTTQMLQTMHESSKQIVSNIR